RGRESYRAFLRPRAAAETPLLNLIIAFVGDVKRVKTRRAGIQIGEEEAVQCLGDTEAGQSRAGLARRRRQSCTDRRQTISRRRAGAHVKLIVENVDLTRIRIRRADDGRRRRAEGDGALALRRTARPEPTAVDARDGADVARTRCVDVRSARVDVAAAINAADDARDRI